MMTKTFKVLSALMTYPAEELQAAAAEFRGILEEEKLIEGDPLASVQCLIEEIETGGLFDLQERYVLLFDRTRSLSLHLFEHIHGESRDRGQALADLAQLYERHGLAVEARELPDYLPLFLEFLSTLPLGEARALLSEPMHIVAALRARLEKRQSPYASVFEALESIAQVAPDEDRVKAVTSDEGDNDPGDLEALDKAWAEDPVTFGPGSSANGGCSGDRVAARIRAALRPASPESGLLPK
jgi:nitrate reductase delta subunit